MSFSLLTDIETNRRGLIEHALLQICLERKLGLPATVGTLDVLCSNANRHSALMQSARPLKSYPEMTLAQYDAHCDYLQKHDLAYQEYVMESKTRQQMSDRMLFVKFVLSATGKQMARRNDRLRNILGALPSTSSSVKGKCKAKTCRMVTIDADGFHMDDSLDVDDQVLQLMRYFDHAVKDGVEENEAKIATTNQTNAVLSPNNRNKQQSTAAPTPTKGRKRRPKKPKSIIDDVD